MFNLRVKPTLIVMAAGLGRRYRGLKQLDSVGPHGEVPLAYCVYDALRAGFGKIVFVISEPMEEMFRERIGRYVEARTDTVYVYQRQDDLPQGSRVPPEREKPWGTGHAILCCREVVKEPFAAINADDFYGPTSYEILCDYLRRARDKPGNCDYAMVGFLLKNTLSPHGSVARGICAVSPDGFLETVTERTRVRERDGIIRYADDDGRWMELPTDSIASMNMWGFTPSLFPELEKRFVRFLEDRAADPNAEYFIPDIVGDLVTEGRARVKVLPTDEVWFGITYREDTPTVRAVIQDLITRGVYPENLWGA